MSDILSHFCDLLKNREYCFILTSPYIMPTVISKQLGGLKINHSYLSGPIVSVSFLMDYLPEVDLAFFFIYLYAS